VAAALACSAAARAAEPDVQSALREQFELVAGALGISNGLLMSQEVV
jgi:hypothetical protein